MSVIEAQKIRLQVVHDKGKYGLLPREDMRAMMGLLMPIVSSVEKKLALPNDQYLLWKAQVERYREKWYLIVRITRYQRYAGRRSVQVYEIFDEIAVIERDVYRMYNVDTVTYPEKSSQNGLIAFILEEFSKAPQKPYIPPKRTLW